MWLRLGRETVHKSIRSRVTGGDYNSEVLFFASSKALSKLSSQTIGPNLNVPSYSVVPLKST
jgi:hypothetical protein